MSHLCCLQDSDLPSLNDDCGTGIRFVSNGIVITDEGDAFNTSAATFEIDPWGHLSHGKVFVDVKDLVVSVLELNTHLIDLGRMILHRNADLTDTKIIIGLAGR